MTKKQSLKITGIVCLVLAFAVFLISRLDGHQNGKGYVLDKYTTVQVTRADGSVEDYDSIYFKTAKKGDTVTASIPLDWEKCIPNSVLCCNVYNCIVTVYLGDRVLYTYGKETVEKGRQIGNLLVCADIPGEAWGKTLKMECVVSDNIKFSKFNPITICEARNRTQYIIDSNQYYYYFSVFILVLFFSLFFILVFWKKGGDIRVQGIYLSLFCISLIVWQMGYENMFYITSNFTGFCGNAEYFGLFAVPAPFGMFLSMVEQNKLFRRVIKILAAMSLGVCILFTILNFTTVNYHYCRFVKVLHVFIIVYAVVIVAEFAMVRCKEGSPLFLIRCGILVYVFSVVADLSSYYLEKIEFFHINRSSNPFTHLGLCGFLLILFISYFMSVMEYFIGKKEKERLESMAFLDGMTGIANRRSCLEYIEGLKNKKDYTIFFVDVNDLKKANDQYGHETGDNLIQSAAQMLKTVFEKKGFCGRYGGDEFIAAVEYSDKGKIKKLMSEISDTIKKINSEGILPFPVSIAVGCASSNEMPKEDAKAVVQLADERMYQDKQRIKSGLK